MTDGELWASWRLWMVVAASVVLVAATLLIVIWQTARGIYSEALRALRAAERIRESTMPIWALATTNEVAGDILTTVQHIEANGGALATALESHAGAR
jgi:ABC-type thiamin/hydroxymethylpyrimidine transport system permease subunit